MPGISLCTVVLYSSFDLKFNNPLANEHGRIHVQKINYKIKIDAILMPIISN